MRTAKESIYFYCNKCKRVVINPEPKKCPLCKGKLVNAKYGKDGYVTI